MPRPARRSGTRVVRYSSFMVPPLTTDNDLATSTVDVSIDDIHRQTDCPDPVGVRPETGEQPVGVILNEA